MRKILLLGFALTLPAGAVWSIESGAALVRKADKICEAWVPVPAKGPVEMKAGFADYCSVFLEIDSELLRRTKSSDILKIKEGLEAVAELIVAGDTPSVTDAEKLCALRVPAGSKPPAAGPFARAAKQMKETCAGLADAKSLVKDQANWAPRPAEYYQNLAAVRTAASGVVISENVWLLVQKMNGSKTRAKPTGN